MTPSSSEAVSAVRGSHRPSGRLRDRVLLRQLIAGTSNHSWTFSQDRFRKFRTCLLHWVLSLLPPDAAKPFSVVAFHCRHMFHKECLPAPSVVSRGSCVSPSRGLSGSC